ncbi:MAG: DUF421 domain-containing protein [Ectobacillus sp.]
MFQSLITRSSSFAFFSIVAGSYKSAKSITNSSPPNRTSISLKSRHIRMWISGQPTVIIENGKLLDANMKKIRYTLDDLNQHLREQGIFDLFEVEHALLEHRG